MMEEDSKTPLSDDECQEAHEEGENEEDEISDHFLMKMGDKAHVLTNPLEIRAMGESPDLRNFTSYSPDWEEDSPLQSIQDENLPQEFMTPIPPTSNRERRRTKDKERSNRTTTSKITRVVEDFFYSGLIDGVKVTPDHSPSPRGAVTPPMRGRRGGRGGGAGGSRGSRPPSGEPPIAESREALRKKKKATMQQRSFDREYKMHDHAQSNSLDIDPLMMSYPTMRSSDMRTANGARSSQLDISVDSTEHYQSLALQPIVRAGAASTQMADGGAEALCSASLNLTSIKRRNAKMPIRHHSFQAGSLNLRGPRIPSELARCPQDRVDFFKTMSAQINNLGKKNKGEEKDLAAARQVSSEEQVFQARLHDLLWLELQAWRYGHSMKSLDEALIQSRETRVPDILSDILDFEYVPCPALSQGLPREKTLEDLGASAESFGSPCQNFSSSSSAAAGSFAARQNSFAAASPPLPSSCAAAAASSAASEGPLSPRRACDSVPASPATPCSLYHDFDAESSHAVFSLHWAPSRYHVATQSDAIGKVRNLLERLQAAESLFPTTKAFGYFFDDYRSDKFTNHVDALNLWLNLTTDLILKVQAMAKFLNLTEMPGLHLPWLDVALPEPDELIDLLSQNLESRRLSQVLTLTDLKSGAEEGRDPMTIADVSFESGKKDSDAGVPFFPLDFEEKNQSATKEEKESELRIALTVPSDDDLNDDDDENDDGDAVTDDEDRCTSVVVNPYKVRFRSQTSEVSDGPPSSASPCISPSKSSPRDIPLSPPVLSPLTLSSPERIHGVSILQSPPNVSTKDLKNPTYESKTIIYRKFVDKSLKQMGLRKLMAKVLNVLQGTMEKIRVALEHPSEAESLMLPDHLFGAKSLSAEALEAYLGQIKQANSMSRCVDALDKMRLPSLRPAALFLARVPLDVVHECLRLRLDQRPRTEPSVLSIRQLMSEYKEVLRTAMTLRQYYGAFVTLIRGEESVRCDRADPGLETFNKDVQEMLHTYFWSLEKWLFLVQKRQDFPVDIRSLLVDEWLFIQAISTLIPSGFVQASAKFWDITAGVFDAVASYLTNTIKPRLLTEPVSGRQNYIDACRSVRNVFKEARERAFKICAFARELKAHTHCAYSFKLCVGMKIVVDRLNSLGYVQLIGPKTPGCLLLVPKSLSQKHENVVVELMEFIWKDEGLNKSAVESRHMLNDVDGYILIVRFKGDWSGFTLKLGNNVGPHPLPLNSFYNAPILFVSPSEKLGSMQRDFHNLVGAMIEPMDEEIPLGITSNESVNKAKQSVLQLMGHMSQSIRDISSHLAMDKVQGNMEVTPGIKKHLRDTIGQCYKMCFEYHKEALKLVSLNGPTKSQLSQNLVTLARQWMSYVLDNERGRVTRPRWAAHGLDFLTVALEPRVLGRLGQGEYESLNKLVTTCLRHIGGCGGGAEGGRGGAAAGEQSGLGAKEPNQRQISPNSPFGHLGPISWPESLSSSGYNSPSVPASPVLSTRSRSFNSASSLSSGGASSVTPKLRLSSSTSYSDNMDEISPGCHYDSTHPLARLQSSAPSTPGVDGAPSSVVNGAASQKSGFPKDRITRTLKKFDEKRNEKRVEIGQIGRVTERKMDPVIQYTGRKVNFRWQRGNKIGEGQYGKVYACVNIDTGQLMAMKCIRLSTLDHKTIKSVTEEIKIIEGFSHPNLVKYFGVELHSDELLLFMEYCGEGTLEEASRGGQLPELMIRRYSRDVLLGISYLHENGIAHRDIKGANIFLTRGGRIKLGDFGCSAKLQSHTTQPGEFNSMVGTVAFMAPEIITKNRDSGHGRMADVWSFGCVVIEMCTGSRPWHDLENNYQIMFKVGMGAKPAVPENASPELEDFLDHCFQFDSKDRWTADQLLDHSFTKVYTEAD